MYRFLVLFVAASVLIFACATYEGAIPVEFSGVESVYLSPGVKDGVQDELRLQVFLPHIANLYVQGYRFEITESDGTEVYSIEESAPVTPSREEIAVPEEFVWTGIYNNGELVPDGEYLYSAKFWDRDGNTGAIGPFPVVIDNSEPHIEIATSHRILSPNGDGFLDTLLIAQRNASFEDRWEK